MELRLRLKDKYFIQWLLQIIWQKERDAMLKNLALYTGPLIWLTLIILYEIKGSIIIHSSEVNGEFSSRTAYLVLTFLFFYLFAPLYTAYKIRRSQKKHPDSKKQNKIEKIVQLIIKTGWYILLSLNLGRTISQVLWKPFITKGTLNWHYLDLTWAGCSIVLFALISIFILNKKTTVLNIVSILVFFLSLAFMSMNDGFLIHINSGDIKP